MWHVKLIVAMHCC